jgi:hypothetical protein
MLPELVMAASNRSGNGSAGADKRERVSAVARVRAVMLFVDEPRTAAQWWADHLGGHAVVRSKEVFCWYEVGGVEVGFHPPDDQRNPRGGSPVVYWAVAELEAERARLLASGCRAHQGPLTVYATRTICQLVDPFGNVFGLDAG